MIVLLGLNHKTASIKIREKFAFLPDEILQFKTMFDADPYFRGMVLVSTCNRTEIYCDFEKNNLEYIEKSILSNLKKFKNYNKDITENIYVKSNKQVIEHIFRVVTGLDSMLLGEYQIVGQLKSAFEVSFKGQFAGKCLNRLFQKAFETGKIARTQTKINEGAVTVSYSAVESAYREFPDLAEKKILSIGAGETGQLVLAGLAKKNCKHITVANRTFAKAAKNAEKYSISAVEIDKLDDIISDFDVILVSTSSKEPLVKTESIKKALIKRDNNPMLLIDLSVPRNIEQSVEKIENVKLLTVDDMNSVISENYEKRRAKIEEVEKIIAVKTNEFIEWLSASQLAPTFVQISANLKKINECELRGFQKNKVEIDYSKAEEYGNHITNKYIRLLIKNIKEVTENGKNSEKLQVVKELLDF